MGGVIRDISILVIERCVEGILIGRDWLKKNKAHIDTEDDVMVINSVKVDLVQASQLEECSVVKHKCCKKGALTTVSNVEAKQMSNKENEGTSDELKHWSCNAYYRTFDVNDVKPWTCNKRSSRPSPSSVPYQQRQHPGNTGSEEMLWLWWE